VLRRYQVRRPTGCSPGGPRKCQRKQPQRREAYSILLFYITDYRLISEQIEQNLLYHYIPELETRACAIDDAFLQKQLSLLINHVKRSYALVRTRVRSLVAVHREITFNLLWTLFKPNDIVYGNCFGTKKPRCIIFDSGEIRKLDDGTEYFHIRGRYLDFNGKDFGEAYTVLGIITFSGAKRIDSLEAFPFRYHPREQAVRRDLIGCGRKFHALVGSHHREYEGVAFFKEKGEINRASISGRIVVDASLFFEIIPNYTKPRFDDNKESNSVDFWRRSTESDKIQPRFPNSTVASDNYLLVCSPTVLGFSLGTKQWRKSLLFDECTAVD
jgi:hypothetical protein